MDFDLKVEDPDGECFHCGTPARGSEFVRSGKVFCCQGCLTVFELLSENGLTDFYRFGEAAGVRVKPATEDFGYLDDPALRQRLVDFTDGRTTRVTFRIPVIHCIACVWLLENLFRLAPGISYSRVNFPRKEVFITFESAQIKLGGVVALLTRLGYGPDLNLADGDGKPRAPVSRRLWIQTGVAGFGFGNIMLLSISSYLGLDAFTGPGLKRMFGWISLILAAPVMVYSAVDYWRAAWLAARERTLTIEIPIAVGIAALAGWSAVAVLTGRGPGYFDTLSGLLFFLLCGKLFQQKTYERLAFDRDYKSFFPLSVLRHGPRGQERIPLARLTLGDRLVVRNGELIPADARLVEGAATIDYSFVTGESEPVAKQTGDHIYAGGRQMGGAIEIETVKQVSQSYLTSLWNQETFAKERRVSLDSLTSRYSRVFVRLVLAVAVGAALFWVINDGQRALKAFVSVLIVACPCALALAAPFALGTAQRVLARRNVFLKNASLIETLARVDAIVFDKTGTLTASGAGSIEFCGEPLHTEERAAVRAVAAQSTHPHAARIAASLVEQTVDVPARSFNETAGCGIEGLAARRTVLMGSAAWLKARGVKMPRRLEAEGSVVHLAIDGGYRGVYKLTNALRPKADLALRELAAEHELALLSGDNEREREYFAKLFGPGSRLHFNQNPQQKLSFVQQLRAEGKTVMMVGDGLNDAGALQASDAGVAVVESVGAFSPASDVIMAADMAPRLHEVLRFARQAARVVRISLGISTVYNLAGLSIAAAGLLSPVFCAILMPASSVTVVAFACVATARLGRALDEKEAP